MEELEAPSEDVDRSQEADDTLPPWSPRNSGHPTYAWPHPKIRLRSNLDVAQRPPLGSTSEDERESSENEDDDLGGTDKDTGITIGKHFKCDEDRCS